MKISEEQIIDIAKACHNCNKILCEAIGDNSQVDWNIAPDWQRQSAINGVKFHIEHPDSKPEDSHNSWLKEKKETGWIYGQVKDVDKKEHPCCVPFDMLPVEQQAKDKLFIEVVRHMEEAFNK